MTAFQIFRVGREDFDDDVAVVDEVFVLGDENIALLVFEADPLALVDAPEVLGGIENALGSVCGMDRDSQRKSSSIAIREVQLELDSLAGSLVWRVVCWTGSAWGVANGMVFHRLQLRIGSEECVICSTL